jgi:hypothetical protein
MKRIAVYGTFQAKVPFKQRVWKKRKDGIRQRYWKTTKEQRGLKPKEDTSLKEAENNSTKL